MGTLQFSALFDRNRSKSSFGRQILVSLVSSDHISYWDGFILSLLQLEWAKSYRVTLCQHSDQIYVLSNFICFFLKFWQLSTRLQYSSQADLEVRYVDQLK